MIGRYINWRNTHAYDEQLRHIVDRGKRNLMRYYGGFHDVACGPAWR